MNCNDQLKQILPADFEGEHLNILISPDNRVWVCIDGQSVLRARGMTFVTVEDNRRGENDAEESS